MNIFEAYNKLRNKWKLLLVVECISIVIALIVIFSIPKEYSSKIILAPETKASTSSYGLVANLVGSFDLGELSGGAYGTSKDAIYPILYPLFFESPTYPKSFFNIKVPYNDSIITLQNYIDKDIKYPWWTNLKNSLLSILSVSSQKEVSIPLGDSIFYISPEEWKTIELLQKRITLTVDKQSFVMTIDVRTQDPVISAIVADSVSQIIKTTITDYRRTKAEQNLNYVQKLYEEAGKNYLEAQAKYRYFLDTHAGISSRQEQIKGDVLKTDAQIALSLYNQLAKQLQLAESKVMEERPVFAVLEPPTVAPKASYPPKFLCLIGFMLIGFLSSIIYIFK